MTVAEIIAALTQLISVGLANTPMVLGWIADRSYLEQLQSEKGADYVPTAEDFAAYDARLAIADAQIDANAERADSGAP
jgi:hypothetical protein